jgi:hypothetical protein
MKAIILYVRKTARILFILNEDAIIYNVQRQIPSTNRCIAAAIPTNEYGFNEFIYSVK